MRHRAYVGEHSTGGVVGCCHREGERGWDGIAGCGLRGKGVDPPQLGWAGTGPPFCTTPCSICAQIGGGRAKECILPHRNVQMASDTLTTIWPSPVMSPGPTGTSDDSYVYPICNWTLYICL